MESNRAPMGKKAKRRREARRNKQRPFLIRVNRADVPHPLFTGERLLDAAEFYTGIPTVKGAVDLGAFVQMQPDAEASPEALEFFHHLHEAGALKYVYGSDLAALKAYLLNYGIFTGRHEFILHALGDWRPRGRGGVECMRYIEKHWPDLYRVYVARLHEELEKAEAGHE